MLFITRMIETNVTEEEILRETNYKELVLQLCRHTSSPSPDCTFTANRGGGFTASVSIQGATAVGMASSKKAAEQEACSQLLDNLPHRAL